MKAFATLLALLQTLPPGTNLVGMNGTVIAAHIVAEVESAHEEHDYSIGNKAVLQYGTAFPWRLDSEGHIWLVTFASLDTAISCWQLVYRLAAQKDRRKPSKTEAGDK